MNLATLECIFADCQSTGASPANGNILEIAWCKANTLSEPDDIKSFVLRQPEDRPIPFMIQNITGIGDKELESAVDPISAYSSFTQAFRENGESQIDFAVIHYGRFEKAFLEDWHRNFAQSEHSLPYKIVCTYEIAKRIFPNLPTRGINGLAGYFGATIHDTKRSTSHVRATWLIWRGLVEQLAKVGVETTAQLEEWLATVKAGKRTKIEYPLEKAKRSKLPDRPGVYRMYDRAGNILYVGKATSLKSRVNSYFRGRAGKDARRMEMLTRVHDLQVTECATPLEAAILETDEIKRLNPPFNVVLKTGRRQLIYYDRELREWSKERDEAHPIGPFSGPFHMEPVLRLSSSLASEAFDAQIFYDFIDPELLKSGFAIYAAEFGLHDGIRTPRQLMTFALKEYKRLARIRKLEAARLAKLAASAKETGATLDTAADTNSGAEDLLELPAEGEDDVGESVDEAEELTPEYIAGKFQRMLLRAAKGYLQAKAVCAIANANVEFNDGGVLRQLQVRAGQISPFSPEVHACSEIMDLVTFDRLRVLISELGRISATSSTVRIQFRSPQTVPLWVVHRAGI